MSILGKLVAPAADGGCNLTGLRWLSGFGGKWVEEASELECRLTKILDYSLS